MTDNTSDEFAKVLEGSDTSEKSDTSGQEAGGKKDTSVTPPSDQTIKVGDRQFSTVELDEKLKKLDEVEALEKEQNISVRELKADYTKKSMELASLKKKVEPIEKAFDKSGNSNSEELPADYEAVRANAKKYHLLSADEIKPVTDRLEKLESVLTATEKKERQESLNRDITVLTKANDFIKRDELLDYMIKKADAGTNLSPDEAARLLYSDKFALIRAKELGYVSPKVPFVDGAGQKQDGIPAAKKLDFDGGKVSDALEESLNTSPVS